MRTQLEALRVEPSVAPDGRPVCEVCDEPVNPDAAGVFSLVVGWAQTRTGGGAHGAHGISDRRDLGRYRHQGCHRHGDAPTMF